MLVQKYTNLRLFTEYDFYSLIFLIALYVYLISKRAFHNYFGKFLLPHLSNIYLLSVEIAHHS